MAVKVVKLVKEVEEKKKQLKVVSPGEQLCLDAKVAYRNFQGSWFQFAKKISEISKTDAWVDVRHESFKAYCLEEFPDMSFGVISKFITVIDSWGATLEARVLKSPNEPLPSYDACYDVAIVEDKIPKEELPKLRKSVLDRTITRAEVRERLRDLRKPHNIPAKTDRKLDKELAKSEAQAKKALEDEAANLELVGDARSEAQAEQLLSRLKLVFDQLPGFTKGLKEASPKVIELAEFLRDNNDKYNEAVESLMTRVEQISTEE